jgi:hypothetical protein
VTAVVQTTHRGVEDSRCGTLDLVRASDGFRLMRDDLGDGVDDYSIADRGTLLLGLLTRESTDREPFG